MNKDLVSFSKQIISARFRAIPAFGTVFETWKALESKVEQRSTIHSILTVKKDIKFIIPFLTITPLTYLSLNPQGFIEISKTFGMGLSLTFTSLLLLPVGVMVIPQTIPGEMYVEHVVPILNLKRKSSQLGLVKEILETLEEKRRLTIKTGLEHSSPNYLSLLTKSTLTSINPISLSLSKYYGLVLPRVFTITRLYQYIDWILTDDALLSSQKPRLTNEELVKALSDRGYNTMRMSRREMEKALEDHLGISMGLRKGRNSLTVDDKIEIFITLTLMACRHQATS